MNKRNLGLILIPLILSAGIVGGIFIGKYFYGYSLSPEEKKLKSILGYIQSEYVDDVNLDSILENSYAKLLGALDPHSVYIPADELSAVNDELESSFSGVGVSFQIINDTVNVVEIVSGGPAEKVGLKAGDKILKANDVNLTGSDATNENVFKNLRGEKGSKVTLEIKRQNADKLLKFDVVRGDVPQTSIDSHYMITDNIGYIKVGKFARTTYEEFYRSLQGLQALGAEKFIIDLRGNTGGYMDQAVQMVNEFLPAGQTIVYTLGRNPLNASYSISNGTGHFVDDEIVVLTDEFSASASEIFSGAIQDNDRGLVIGRRTYGKGLVQNQFPLPDNSAIRLTVARYYTPSGRSIQKEYKIGESEKYELDITDRYSRGEFFNIDSIRLDKSKVFTTSTGREVYGGGGIMPDLFVPEDSTGMTSYYVSVANAGLIQQYAYKLADKYRVMLDGTKSISQVLKVLPRDETLLDGFVEFAASKGVPARWYYIRKSSQLILNQLKAIVVRDVLGYPYFIRMLNEHDNTVKEGIRILNENQSPTIILPAQ